MARQRLTIKRIDPWSVLKFGAFLSFVLYLVMLVVGGVVWFIIDRLQLIDQACEIALDVGFTACGVNPTNLFQVVALLGAMWVIVQTALLVFLAFLHNLIADLTGGVVVGVVDDRAAPPNAAAGPVMVASSGRSDRITTPSEHTGTGQRETRAVAPSSPTEPPSPAPERRSTQQQPVAPDGSSDGPSSVAAVKGEGGRTSVTDADESLFGDER